jgi:hypothetical protein
MTVRTKQDAARILSDISGDKRFYSQDGCVISNLSQLAECLTHINDYSFGHHVTPEKNDFSNWVRDVLVDEKLARDINHTTNHLEAAEVVRARISWLQEKMKK